MLTFILAVFFMIITPGPGVLSAAGIGAAYGAKAGLRFIAGLCVGQALVYAAVATGFASIVLSIPMLRYVLMTLSLGYLLFLAFRIATAGSKIAFITAKTEPGFWAGFLLQPINPKAYAVMTTLIGGFAMFPNDYLAEVLWKFVLLNIVWIPLHVGWVYFGVTLKRLDLGPTVQKSINVFMALSMLIVIALAYGAMAANL